MSSSSAGHTYEEMESGSIQVDKLPESFVLKSKEEMQALCIKVDCSDGYSEYLDIHDYPYTEDTFDTLANIVVDDYDIYYDNIQARHSFRIIRVQRVRVKINPEGYWQTIPVNFIKIPDYFFLQPKM